MHCMSAGPTVLNRTLHFASDRSLRPNSSRAPLALNQLHHQLQSTCCNPAPVFRSSPLDHQPYSKYRSIPTDRSLLFFASYRRCSAIPLTAPRNQFHRSATPSRFSITLLSALTQSDTDGNIPQHPSHPAQPFRPASARLTLHSCTDRHVLGYPALLTGESLWIEPTTKALQSRYYVQFSSGTIINKALARSQPATQLLSFTYTCVPPITSP